MVSEVKMLLFAELVIVLLCILIMGKAGESPTDGLDDTTVIQ